MVYGLSSVYGLLIFMCCDANVSTSSAIVRELKECAKAKDLERGRLLHHKAVKCGCLHNNIYVASTLVSMYTKCGRMQDAWNVFQNMSHHDIVSWNVLMFGYLDNGQARTALELFHSLDCSPDSVTLVAALKACARLAGGSQLDKDFSRQTGLGIHKVARVHCFDREVAVVNTLIDMYRKQGDMSNATEVFYQMDQKDTVTWNVIIMGYVESGETLKALDVFGDARCAPSCAVFASALKACVGLTSVNNSETCLSKGSVVHRRAKQLGFDKDMFVASILVEMYSKCGKMTQARRVFERMKRRDVVSWTSLILGYLDNGDSLTALDVFTRMDCTGDRVTFLAAIRACAALAAGNTVKKETCLRRGMYIHQQAAELGFDKDILVSNTLVDMYSKCGDMHRARCVFDKMAERSVVSWNVLILGYYENGESSSAIELFKSMDCAPDSVTFVAALKACAGLPAGGNFSREQSLREGMDLHKLALERGFVNRHRTVANTLIDMYSKLQDMVQARQVFNYMEHRDVVSWNILMFGYLDNGRAVEALDVFELMDCPPDRVTLMAALRACGEVGALDIGQRIHVQVCESGLEQDDTVNTSLIDFYGKCGNMDAAESVFSRRSSQSTVSWNTLIGGYSLLGDSSQVFRAGERMRECGVRMDGVTMLLILSACGHAGLVEEGVRYFEAMPKHGVEPTVEHYGCMIDMLGRAGRVREASSLLKGMPFQSNVVITTALLNWNRDESSLPVSAN